jgi:hypothetical protein
MLYKFFIKAMSSDIVTVCSVLPRNLRQYYADQLLLMKTEMEFGITA